MDSEAERSWIKAPVTQPEEERPDERLLERVEHFLDGRLEEEEALAFEDELRADGVARRALVDSLTMRAMVDLAMEPASEPTVTTPTPRVRGWVLVAALTLIVGGAFVAWEFSQGDDRAAVAGGAAPWPRTPVEAQDFDGIVAVVGSLTASRDPVAPSAMLARILPPGPESEELVDHPAVKAELKRLGAAELDVASRREVVALLLLLNDDRLSFTRQSCAIGPLILRLGSTSLRPLLLERALRADEAGAMSVHVIPLAPLLGPSDEGVIVSLLRRAQSVPAPPVVGCLVDRLGFGGFPNGAEICLEVLLGDYGSWQPDVHARAAFACARIMDDAGNAQSRSRLQGIALEHTDPAMRCYAADALLLRTKEDRWKAVLSALADRNDAVGERARRALKR